MTATGRLDTAMARGEAPCRAGEVIEVAGREARLRLGEASANARIALSCLLRPEPGDRVLTVADGEVLWVLAVLDRPGGGPVTLAAPGDLTIAAPAGRLGLAAAGEVALDAGGGLRVAAESLALQAAEVRSTIGEVLHVGRRVTAQLDRLRVVGALIESFAEHLVARARRSSRFVEETDQSRCGEIDQRARRTLHLHAEAAFVSAKTLVRVDSDQIHMG